MNIAYVLVQSTIGHEMEVLSDLLKIDLVKEAKGTFGYYDILVKIEYDSFCNFRTRTFMILFTD